MTRRLQEAAAAPLLVVHRNRRSLLLTSALATGIIAATGMWPGSGVAWADCVGDTVGNPNTVACLSDDADGIQFTADDPVNVQVGFPAGPDTLITIDDGIGIDANNQTDNDVYFNIDADATHAVEIINDGGGGNGDAVFIITDAGNVTFTSDANSTLNANPLGVGDNGLHIVTDEGNVSINSNSDIYGYNDIGDTFEYDGVLVTTDEGNVTMVSAGRVTGGSTAINVQTESGDIEITQNNGNSTFDLFAEFNDGIYANSFSGNVKVTLGANVGVDAGTNGVNASSSSGNVVVILQNGVTIDPDDTGVNEFSSSGSVRATVGQDTTILITNENDDDNTALGIFAQSGNTADDEDTGGPDANDDASVVITTGGGNTINVTGANSYAAGILGRNDGGGSGSVSITTGTHYVDFFTDVGDTILVNGVDGGGTNDADNITGILGQVSNSGTGSVTIVGGAGLDITVLDNVNNPSDVNSAGIAGLSSGGDVTITTLINNYAGNTIAVTNGHGILARADGDGQIMIDSSSAITTTNIGNGIDAATTGVDPGGPGDITITSRNTINAAKHGIAARASGFYGDVYLDVMANVTAAESAVRVFDAQDVTLDTIARTAIRGAGTNNDAVIDIDSDATTSIDNFAMVFSNSATLIDQSNDLAINTDGGTTVLNNGGTIIGRVNFTGNGDVFNNYSNTTWTFTGDSDFGGGADALNNTGRTVTAVNDAAGELTRLLSLESFNNGDPAESDLGTLTLIDQTAGQTFFQDKTATSGNFDGVGNSTLGVDVVLDVDGTGISDLLLVATASGTTFVQINDIDTGPGGFNPYGITVVEVMGADSSTFQLAGPGFYDKGFFRWTIEQETSPGLAADADFPGGDQTPNTTWELVSAPGPAAFETAQLMSIAQDFWHTSGAVWDEFNYDLLNPTGYGQSTDIKDGAYIPSGTVAGGVAIWGRVTGATSDRTVSNFNGIDWVDGGYNQHLWAFTGGIDYTAMGAGGTVVAGLLGGYGTTNVNFDSGNTATLAAGSAGAYATWLGGPAYIGALFKADFLDIDYAAGGEMANTNGLSLGGKIDAGIRIASAGGGVFFEPNASIAYVTTHIDDFTMLGTDVEFTDGASLRGTLGARLGTTIMTGGATIIEPYVSAAVGDEFLGQYSVFLDSGPGVTVGDDISGIFGDVGGGVTVKGTNSAFSAFAKGQYIFAEEYYNIIGKAGARVGF